MIKREIGAADEFLKPGCWSDFLSGIIFQAENSERSV
jgi:hypothetical protein